MAAGAAAFDALTPGWRDEVVALGAVPFDASADAAMRFPAGWLPRTRSGITMYACSRALLEDVLRRGFALEPTVRLREGQKVLGLLSDPPGERVTGVRTADTHGSGTTNLPADLVVDASGTGSTLPRWIAAPAGRLADAHVDETVIESGTQYVSRWFHLEPGDAPDWHCLSVAPAAGAPPRSAMMLRAEEDRWGVVLLAAAGEPLPFDDTSFLDFTAGLGDGKLRDGARPREAGVPHPSLRPHRQSRQALRSPDDLARGARRSRRRRMHARSVLRTGHDGYCSGRGAVSRTCLDQEAGGVVPAVEFQKELASLNAQPWRLATGREPDGHPLARDETHLEPALRDGSFEPRGRACAARRAASAPPGGIIDGDPPE